jgi:hypothetical protein
MTNFKLEPFLWIHLAGLTMIPLMLEGVWLALSLGSPLGAWWLEFAIVAVIGIIPIFFLQFKRPFNFFSLLLLAISPNLLTTEQRQILSLIKQKNQRIVQIIALIFMLVILWQLYKLAPIAILITNHLPQWRIFALVVASLLLAMSHLFLQVALSILPILFTTQAQFKQIEPYPMERIYVDFTTPPIFVKKIIPLINN